MTPEEIEGLEAVAGKEMTDFLMENVVGHPRPSRETLDLVQAECNRMYPGASITLEAQKNGTVLHISVVFRS